MSYSGHKKKKPAMKTILTSHTKDRTLVQ